MAETKRMTAEQVVSYLLEGRRGRFLARVADLGRAAADGGGGVGADRRRARRAQPGLGAVRGTDRGAVRRCSAAGAPIRSPTRGARPRRPPEGPLESRDNPVLNGSAPSTTVVRGNLAARQHPRPTSFTTAPARTTGSPATDARSPSWTASAADGERPLFGRRAWCSPAAAARARANLIRLACLGSPRPQGGRGETSSSRARSGERASPDRRSVRRVMADTPSAPTSSPTASSPAAAIRSRPGATKPEPGTCRRGLYNATAPSRGSRSSPGRRRSSASRRSSSRTSARSTTSISARTRSRTARSTGQSQVQGYDCVSTGTQDDAAELDEQHRPERRLRHPGPRRTRRRCRSTRSGRAACTRTARSTSRTPTTSACTGSRATAAPDLEPNNNQTSLTLGHVEDKQWVAVNHFAGSRYQDHVYAMWTTFNGAAGNGKIRLAVSRDRGQTFSKAVTITPPG